MKKMLRALSIFGLIIGLAGAGVSMAQDMQKPKNVKPGEMQERMKKRQEKTLNDLTKKLKLTPEQRTKIEEIYRVNAEKRKQRMEEMKSKREEKLNDMKRGPRAGIESEIEKVLTPAQVKKYKKMRAEMRKNRGRRGEHRVDRGERRDFQDRQQEQPE